MATSLEYYSPAYYQKELDSVFFENLPEVPIQKPRFIDSYVEKRAALYERQDAQYRLHMRLIGVAMAGLVITLFVILIT